jgi:hypothetical protein
MDYIPHIEDFNIEFLQNKSLICHWILCQFSVQYEYLLIFTELRHEVKGTFY